MPFNDNLVQPVAVRHFAANIEQHPALEIASTRATSNLVAQINHLSETTVELFSRMHRQVMEIQSRLDTAHSRLTAARTRMAQQQHEANNSASQLASRSPTDSSLLFTQRICSGDADAFQSRIIMQEDFMRRPDTVHRLYKAQMPTPDLTVFDQYRQDSKKSQEFFSDPGFFFRNWKVTLFAQIPRKTVRRQASRSLLDTTTSGGGGAAAGGGGAVTAMIRAGGGIATRTQMSGSVSQKQMHGVSQLTRALQAQEQQKSNEFRRDDTGNEHDDDFQDGDDFDDDEDDEYMNRGQQPRGQLEHQFSYKEVDEAVYDFGLNVNDLKLQQGAINIEEDGFDISKLRPPSTSEVTNEEMPLPPAPTEMPPPPPAAAPPPPLVVVSSNERDA